MASESDVLDSAPTWCIVNEALAFMQFNIRMNQIDKLDLEEVIVNFYKGTELQQAHQALQSRESQGKPAARCYVNYYKKCFISALAQARKLKLPSHVISIVQKFGFQNFAAFWKVFWSNYKYSVFVKCCTT